MVEMLSCRLFPGGSTFIKTAYDHIVTGTEVSASEDENGGGGGGYTIQARKWCMSTLIILHTHG